MDTRIRFAAWVAEVGKRDAADLLGVDPTYISHLLRDPRRRPGLDVAFSIERATAEWSSGPILASEWAEVREPRVQEPSATGTEG